MLLLKLQGDVSVSECCLILLWADLGFPFDHGSSFSYSIFILFVAHMDGFANGKPSRSTVSWDTPFGQKKIMHIISWAHYVVHI